VRRQMVACSRTKDYLSDLRRIAIFVAAERLQGFDFDTKRRYFLRESLCESTNRPLRSVVRRAARKGQSSAD
jgi:hypothetical protein